MYIANIVVQLHGFLNKYHYDATCGAKSIGLILTKHFSLNLIFLNIR